MSEEPHRLEARMLAAADDDMVVQGDAERLGGVTHLLGHLDIGAGRLHVAARVVVDDAIANP